MLDKLHTGLLRAGAPDGCGQLPRTAVNEDSGHARATVRANQLRGVAHVPAKLADVFHSRRALFALDDDGVLVVVQQQHVEPALVLEDHLPRLRGRVGHEPVLQSVRERGDEVGERPLRVELREDALPVVVIFHRPLDSPEGCCVGPANEGAQDAAAFTFEQGRSRFDTYLFQGKLGGATGPTLVLVVPVAVMRVGLRYGLLGMSLVGLLILIALTVVTKQVAAALARPLVAIEHVAKSLGAGDASIRVPEEGDREIASLARSFNQMIEQVSTANAQTIRSEKMAAIGQLAAGIAHEINNPMSYVTSNLCALAADLDALLTNPALLDDYRREILPETIEGVRRVNAIVADLRRFARGDPEAMIEYDLNDEVRAAARISHCRFGPGRALELHLNTLPRLMGHPRQLGQVVVNLLVNAAQAIPGRGTVTVSTDHDADAVLLTVTDTGTGMSAQTKAKLFQPYFTTKSEADGTGLGLYVAARIVHEHGGTISVESRLGHGSSFTVRLSRHQTPRVMLVGAASRSPMASLPSSLARGDESAS